MRTCGVCGGDRRPLQALQLAVVADLVLAVGREVVEALSRAAPCHAHFLPVPIWKSMRTESGTFQLCSQKYTDKASNARSYVTWGRLPNPCTNTYDIVNTHIC